MPRGFEDRERARLAGQKSRRRPNKMSEKLRNELTKGLDTNKLLKELNTLSGKEYVNSVALLLKYAIPTLQSTRLEGESVADALLKFQTMTTEQQNEVMDQVNQKQNEL